MALTVGRDVEFSEHEELVPSRVAGRWFLAYGGHGGKPRGIEEIIVSPHMPPGTIERRGPGRRMLFVSSIAYLRFVLWCRDQERASARRIDAMLARLVGADA